MDSALKTAARLDDKQAGHIRHILNLAAQPDGEWAKMGTIEPGQEGLSSYRYQLAYLAYALGVAHYHRLPAARGVFKPAFEAIMRKMRRMEVWGYWMLSSRSSQTLDPDLTELREGWIDPVVKENIMYSGHLHAMAGMYATLFDDDRYAEPGGLNIKYETFYAPGGPQTFEYDFHSLNDVIYWQMVQNGWLGVACEPNSVFVVCNQFPILGFRFHDVRHGSNVAEEATAAYKAAWARKGILSPNGSYVLIWRPNQDMMIKGAPNNDAWTSAVLNAWNKELVQELRPSQVYGSLRRHADGRVTPWGYKVLGKALKAHKAGEPVPADLDDRGSAWLNPDFGYAAIYLSELGDRPYLDGLLDHADRFMGPTWEKGGFYYPRNDQGYDADGNLSFVEPLTGNALIAYARLNVEDGLRALYQSPWDRAHFASPNLAEISGGVDVLVATYDAAERRLFLTLRGVEGQTGKARLKIANVPAEGNWELRRDGQLLASSADQRPARAEDGGLVVEITVGAATDLILHLQS